MDILFPGLTLMEFVMMIMGIIIFLALVFLLIWQVMKQRPYTQLLIGFLIPIILVGYPTIQSIKFQKGDIDIVKYGREITKNAEEVAKNPKDTVASHQLEKQVTEFQKKASVQTNPEALATVARAQLALGKLDSAASTIKKAAELAPQSEAVKTTANAINGQLKQKAKFREDVRLLSQQVAKLQAEPKDTATTTSVIRTMADLQIPNYVDASSALVIARSYAVLNQKEKSLKVVDNVLKTAPGDVEAKRLKKAIEQDELATTKAKLTPNQRSRIRRELQSAPVVGDKALIRTTKKTQ